MEVLSKNYTCNYCVEYVRVAGIKFKIVSESFQGTNYKLYVQQLTELLTTIALCSNDIKDIDEIVDIPSYSYSDEKMSLAKKNIKTAKKWLSDLYE